MTWRILLIFSLGLNVGLLLAISFPAAPEPAYVNAPFIPRTGGYVASSKSAVFHKALCKWAVKIPEANRQPFATREAALAAGKTPCKECSP